jgi:hypothetical protein
MDNQSAPDGVAIGPTSRLVQHDEGGPLADSINSPSQAAPSDQVHNSGALPIVGEEVADDES